MAFLTVAHALLATASVVYSTDCGSWTMGSAQVVKVLARDTVVIKGPSCTALRNVSVTLQCAPGATVVLRGWNLVGGFVSIEGSPSPFTMDSVTIAVDSCRIWATEGPAVGADVVASAGLVMAFNRLRLTSRRSDLRSIGSVSSNILGITVTSFPNSAASIAITGFESVMLNTTAVAMAASQPSDRTVAVVGGIAIVGVTPTTAASISITVLNVLMMLADYSTATATSTGNTSVAVVVGVTAATSAIDPNVAAALFSNVSALCFGTSLASAVARGASSAGATVAGVALTGVSTWSVSMVGVSMQLLNTRSSRSSSVSSLGPSAAAVGGVAITSATYTPLRFFNVTFAAAQADCACSAAGLTNSAAGAIGVAVSSTSKGLDVFNVTFSLSNSKGVVDSNATYSASSIGGICVGVATSGAIAVDTVTLYVGFSVVTSASVATSAASLRDGVVSSSSAIGVVVGLLQNGSPLSISGTRMFFGSRTCRWMRPVDRVFIDVRCHLHGVFEE